MEQISFKKMHGLGNDFVVVDVRGLDVGSIIRHAEAISHRQLGIGCDQFILIDDAQSQGADCYMHIYNPDGSEAGACGNATRCVARLFMDEANQDSCVIETQGGLLHCQSAGETAVTVNMGKPNTLERKELAVGDLPEAVLVDVGNPHAIFFVQDAEAIALEDIGPVVEHHNAFPNRTNVEFVTKMDDQNLRMRVWERGAGVTMACGSGACAAVCAGVYDGKVQADTEVNVILDGGTLTIRQDSATQEIFMTGPIAHVFDGIYHAG
jgi:diaminopimelate epimerase